MRARHALFGLLAGEAEGELLFGHRRACARAAWLATAAKRRRCGSAQGRRWTGTGWEPPGAAAHAIGHFALADLPGAGLVLFGGLTVKVLESADNWVLRCAP